MGFSEKEADLVLRFRVAVAKGQELKVLQRVPHLTLLSEPYYHETLKPLLAEWLMLYLRRQGLRDITDEQEHIAATSSPSLPVLNKRPYT